MRLRLAALALSLAASAAMAKDFTLSSPQIKPGATLTDAQVFNGFGCSGGNVSPALAWRNAPEGTKSFALTVYDPDAPTGSGWWHWVVYNIPAGVNALPEGAGYGGACPPVGDKPHRYIFTVHALKTERLEIPDGATAALIGYMINANKLGSASFTAYYGR